MNLRAIDYLQIHKIYFLRCDKASAPLGAPAAGSSAYQATDVGILSAFAAPRSSTKEFYRLSVR
ncbi:MAG: hypothetical protein ORN51_00890 [Akkermansiaceae bacterium]|nr:hypothetical protein [Akkermansiaceae bacterium]